MNATLGRCCDCGPASWSWRRTGRVVGAPCRFTGVPGRAAPRSSILEPDGPVMCAARLEPEVTVGFVPVKGERPEWVVQKLTESGVDRIVVLESLTRRRALGGRAPRPGPWNGYAGWRVKPPHRAGVVGSPMSSGVTGLDDLSRCVAPLPLALAQLGGAPPGSRCPPWRSAPKEGGTPRRSRGTRWWDWAPTCCGPRPRLWPLDCSFVPSAKDWWPRLAVSTRRASPAPSPGDGSPGQRLGPAQGDPDPGWEAPGCGDRRRPGWEPAGGGPVRDRPCGRTGSCNHHAE